MAEVTGGTADLERRDLDIQVRCGALTLPLSPGSIESMLGSPDVDATVEEINNDPAKLHEVLEQQYYRLACWRAGNDDINYRRFVGVNGLIAIRAEDPEAFARSHPSSSAWRRTASSRRFLPVASI